ncbi:uncharacterized protein PADG_00264 [Paracoccidioides brasiliensis Pb18]|uniref:RBR-type E3 ubiquitin transferase n=1 Tax=Paracoccidioides brasiliensis (strain Pb18) TaxID=502780 RepID=C1G074_PARBD|nr:uncharacterized protein PADG_00264 [Paracoccidioides brasiliensis Pb18]EEH43975.1 hypothetical protein PADG_00264 [Paracoccidioides brasiliensis Pb18]ODH50481.1 hypothetical protein GX48_03442 [Paracoccidioides brasiliensis]
MSSRLERHHHHHSHHRSRHRDEGGENKHRRRRSHRVEFPERETDESVRDSRRNENFDSRTAKGHSYIDRSSSLSTPKLSNSTRVSPRESHNSTVGKGPVLLRNTTQRTVMAHWEKKYPSRRSRVSDPPQHSSHTTTKSSSPSRGRSNHQTTKIPSKAQKAPPVIAHLRSARTVAVKDKPENRPALVREGGKSPSVFGTFFRGPSPAKPAVEKKVTCLTCLSDDIPISKVAKLACSHRMCGDCLKRIFELSVKDPQHMPPKCCTSDHIPLKHVDKLFDQKFKMQWNKKYQEYTTKNRIYCPAKGCGEWIKPSNIHLNTRSGATGGRKYGKCSKCRTKVCALCNGKWHMDSDCPKDEDTRLFAEVAKEEGWQKCFNCKAVVELREGCNHMTCRCTAEFCMICGAKWKTCECPWFSNAAIEADRLNHIVMRRRQGHFPNHILWGNPMQFQRQMDMDMRRQQEVRDEHMARHLHRWQEMDEHMTRQLHLRRQQEVRDEQMARNLQGLFGRMHIAMPGPGGYVMNPNEQPRFYPVQMQMLPWQVYDEGFVAPFEETGHILLNHTPSPPPRDIRYEYYEVRSNRPPY